MAKIITENFKVETTDRLFDSLATDNFYVMASQSLDGIEFEGEPGINNTQIEKRDFQRKVIFGNKINKANARYMFLENPYQSGRVYDEFDDAKNTESSNMVITVQEDGSNNFLVLKCIDNNNGAISYEVPGAVDDTVYSKVTTQDGYVWQYLFTVDKAEIDQYKTGSHLPLPTYQGADGLSYGDPEVAKKAQEDISNIKIESTYEGQFSQYLFGEATSSANTSSVQSISSIDSATPGVKRIVVSTTPKTGRALYSVDGAYKNMYLRHNSSGTLYDVVDSITSIGSNQLTLFVRMPEGSTDSFVPVDGPVECQLVIKINVSASKLGFYTEEGVSNARKKDFRCKAYGVLDETGTLKRVAFESRGRHYKHATAEVVYPPLLKGSQSVADNPTILRAIVSPVGGHGSDPISELAMSRLALVTNFDGANEFVPDFNTYTIVGLLKNPTITDANGVSTIPTNPTLGHSFDNRAIIRLPGNELQTPVDSDGRSDSLNQGGKVNQYVEQYIKTIDIQAAVDGVSYTIVDQGNMTTTDDWSAFQAEGVLGGEIGTVFTMQNRSQIDGSRVAKVAFATTKQNVSDNNYDYSLDIITARISELRYVATDDIGTPVDKTEIYLVDYHGNFAHKLQKGIFYIKDNLSSSVSINNEIADEIVYGEYEVYSGDLLHFIDFAPITREADKSEKIKFTFDF
jgi:hypothetical protein